ncbi:hypothetical protein [Halomarina pelagica]|uniref:hypothetical protein n=1 Tax=Halomarina pelagica TaxID=2961599 RepID=UPI0020C3A176|nr:hypothetical protein [Halomarina sp. BND7]
MNLRATPTRVTVGIVVATLLLSGPHGVVDLTPERGSGFGSGEGAASVRDVALPDAATLERGRYGADAYALSVPPARATVRDVTGRPILVYAVSVPDLGYSRVTLRSLDATTTGRVELALARDAFAPDRIDRATYEAELSLTLRSGEEVTVLRRETVTVEVVG